MHRSGALLSSVPRSFFILLSLFIAIETALLSWLYEKHYINLLNRTSNQRLSVKLYEHSIFLEIVFHSFKPLLFPIFIT
uniref:Putative secreted protein n=1 Tax=Anopheles darlingi TaxID=43151 RepID=A0A2M4DF87_ANODA